MTEANDLPPLLKMVEEIRGNKRAEAETQPDIESLTNELNRLAVQSSVEGAS